ncbi:MAG TPA: hypothetical protein VFJ04_01885 [Rhodanobacteraceae bacterium]|jgi:hypothetical protein|nr:hypothetical protein [Rhodanobacteraceae bacterium]
MRRIRKLLLAASLALVATAALATDYTLASGRIRFSTPDSWLRIMQAQGDPEIMAFQVPDPSPTARDTLARVTVSSQRVADIAGFKNVVALGMDKARTLPGYRRDAAHSGSTWLAYTAEESGVSQTYVEHYYFTEGHAVQLRCVRPTASQAGAEWTAAFDQGCAAIATQLQ